MHHAAPPPLGAQKFRFAASSRISLSSVRSATADFSRRFSNSNAIVFGAAANQQVVDSSGGDVNWVYRHFPLGFHNPLAQKEAEEELGRRLIAIARTLTLEPTAILYDEPTTGLDPLSTRRFKDLLLDESRRGTTILLSTHVLDVAAEVSGCTIGKHSLHFLHSPSTETLWFAVFRREFLSRFPDASPAAAINVGTQSCIDMISFEILPAGIFPGQRTRQGTR